MNSAGLPLRMGTPAQFEAARALMEQAGFSERAICRRLGIEAFTSFADARPGPLAPDLGSALDALICLFIECEPAPREVVERLFGAAATDALTALGLLEDDPEDAERVIAPVGVCPTRDLYLASDRGSRLGVLPEDVVYPPMLENTQAFLDLIPDSPCGSFLDLGTGTGVAALLAAKRFAREAWACDITERSAHFAEFNRKLNGLDNVTVARGDLYEAVGDRQFDRIVTHPPYVPVAKTAYIFRDGGSDGEQIVRRAIEGLPGRLAPGGRFYAQTLVSDRKGAPAEQRIRDWLGEAGASFDVAVIAETARQPSDFLGRAMQKGLHRLEELQFWANTYRELEVTYLVYGCILIQRHESPRENFTIRLQKGPCSGIAEAEWALLWNTDASRPGWAEMALQAPILLSAELKLAVLHSVAGGRLAPIEYLLRVSHPFEAECRCPAWVAALLMECDGRSARDILNSLKAKGVVDYDTAESEFAEVLRVLLGSAFLQLAEYPVPRRPSTRSS